MGEKPKPVKRMSPKPYSMAATTAMDAAPAKSPAPNWRRPLPPTPKQSFTPRFLFRAANSAARAQAATRFTTANRM